MATLIETPTEIAAAGNKPKVIEEFIGRVNSGTQEVSIARMRSSEGWSEPGQRPTFDEYTVVLAGTLRLEMEDQTLDVHAGQAAIVPQRQWVRYSTPHEGGAEYVSVCVPAFSLETVHREQQ